MDTPQFIRWMADIDLYLTNRHKERQDEKEARHEAQSRIARVINGIQLEVEALSDDHDNTKSDVRSLQEIARDTNALLQGVMGRQGIVGDVGEHGIRLDRMEDVLAKLVTLNEKNAENIEKQSKEIKWMQRILYMAIGAVVFLQFIGVDRISGFFR